MGNNPRKVLIADDSATTVMYLSILLNRMGFTLMTAKDGIEALGIIKRDPPDVILLDIHMPVMDGIATLRQLKIDPQTREIPVVIITIDADDKTIGECKKLGCADYLTKPVNLTRLHQLIQSQFTKEIPCRKYLRAPYRGWITVSHRGKIRDYYAVTLSEGGIYLRGNNPPVVGTELELSIPVENSPSCIVQGKVIYHKGVFEGEIKIEPGFAVEFKNIGSEMSRRLRLVIKRLLASDLMDDPEAGFLALHD